MKKNKDKGATALMLKTDIVSPQQVLKLMQRTPANHIYKRPSKGGGADWDYVTGTYVTKVLNYVFGWGWSFEVVDKGKEDNQVWVQGRLTIRDDKGTPRIIKDQFGRADVKMKKSGGLLDYGNDLKAASTDALKKCASLLGIASDVYGKNEFKDIKYEEAEESGTNADDVASSIKLLEKCKNNEEFRIVWTAFPKEIKSNQEVLTTANKIKFNLSNKQDENSQNATA